MYEMYKEAFDRLPERFRKVNNEKLYYVLYNDFENLRSTFFNIKDSRNIDIATGKTLDNIGANVGQFRIDEDDDLYRLLIKTRIIANLSIGDIETINLVMSILVKDIYLGLSETWTDEYAVKEPAAIELNLGPLARRIPVEIINRIKAAGVRVYLAANYRKDYYVGSFSASGERITIMPPQLEDILINYASYHIARIYAEHENITIKER